MDTEEKKPLRVFIIAGSNRRQYDCPGVDSKARALMLRMAKMMPKEWEVDVEDLGNVYKRPRIAPCNGCVSTSMALCVWPCNCYTKNSSAEPDLMWDLDMYSRIDQADALGIIGPVNWYSCSSTLKLMFDRLVCMNGGNPREDLIKHKDPELAMKLEQSPEWKELSLNHLEGRSAGFFCYGDGGGDEIDSDGRPKILKHKEYFEPKEEPFENLRDTYRPLVWQCRYGGIEVPDQLWKYEEFGKGGAYSENQAEHIDEKVYASFDSWVNDFVDHVEKKGKVKPGKYRAYGYTPPGKFVSEIVLKMRGLKIALGKPEPGSSPFIQQTRGLNQDATLRPAKSTAQQEQIQELLKNREHRAVEPMHEKKHEMQENEKSE